MDAMHTMADMETRWAVGCFYDTASGVIKSVRHIHTLHSFTFERVKYGTHVYTPTCRPHLSDARTRPGLADCNDPHKQFQRLLLTEWTYP
eukprot:295242-Chlamydomonas_euryale.AAC.3